MSEPVSPDSRMTSCPGDVLGGSVLDQETSRVSAAVAGTEGLSPASQSRATQPARRQNFHRRRPRASERPSNATHTRSTSQAFFPRSQTAIISFIRSVDLAANVAHSDEHATCPFSVIARPRRAGAAREPDSGAVTCGYRKELLL